jgi:hypothetical protein
VPTSQVCLPACPGEFLAPGLPTLITIIAAALRDPSRDVVSAALQVGAMQAGRQAACHWMLYGLMMWWSLPSNTRVL